MEAFADVDIPTPDVPAWLAPVWRCWTRLHLDRPWWSGGMGPSFPGRIPWREVREWADHHDMSGDDHAFLDRCIRDMDSVFLEFHADRARRAQTSKPR